MSCEVNGNLSRAEGDTCGINDRVGAKNEENRRVGVGGHGHGPLKTTHAYTS